MVREPDPIYFSTPVDFRAWLAENHATANELWVGFHRKDTGVPSLTWPESVDEALCVGWIDGIRKRIDEHRYAIRFTPRRKNSIWSAVNIARMEVLTREGRVLPAGRKAFEDRVQDRSQVYSYEQRKDVTLDEPMERRFRENAAAWAYFQGCPAGYRQTAIWWVVSARREETRQRRLDTLIEDSANSRRIGLLRREPGG